MEEEEEEASKEEEEEVETPSTIEGLINWGRKYSWLEW